MALTPYTRQEEWYQQMINASTGNYLPSITAQDEGKVLTVENDGSWGVENVPQELPAVETTDKDKYLHTNASTGAVEWSAVEDELPAVTSSDKDKYLHTNDSTGAVEWADAPAALPAVTDVDEGKVLTVNDSGVWVAQTPASGGGVLVVHETVSGSTYTLDKTFKEIKDAGFSVLYTEEDGEYFVYGMSNIDYSNYSVTYGSQEYTATSEDGYPSYEQGH